MTRGVPSPRPKRRRKSRVALRARPHVVVTGLARTVQPEMLPHDFVEVATEARAAESPVSSEHATTAKAHTRRMQRILRSVGEVAVPSAVGRISRSSTQHYGIRRDVSCGLGAADGHRPPIAAPTTRAGPRHPKRDLVCRAPGVSALVRRCGVREAPAQLLTMTASPVRRCSGRRFVGRTRRIGAWMSACHAPRATVTLNAAGSAPARSQLPTRLACAAGAATHFQP